MYTSRLYGRTNKKDKRLFLILTGFAAMIIIIVSLFSALIMNIKNKPINIDMYTSHYTPGKYLSDVPEWNVLENDKTYFDMVNTSRAFTLNATTTSTIIRNTFDLRTTRKFNMTFSTIRSSGVSISTSPFVGFIFKSGNDELFKVGMSGTDAVLNNEILAYDFATIISYDHANNNGSKYEIYYDNGQVIVNHRILVLNQEVIEVDNVDIDSVELVCYNTQVVYKIFDVDLVVYPKN